MGRACAGGGVLIGRRRSDLRTVENGIKGDFDPYAVADFSIGVKKDNLRFELYATNLFNSNGVINSGVQCVEAVCGDAGGDTASGGVFYDVVTRPRIIGIKAGFDF